jgi:hypothetical protein
MNLLLFQKKRLSKGIRLALDFMGGTLDSRISFSRGSNATVVGSNGLIQYAPHNLLTYSEQFDNAAWLKRSGSTVNANTLIAPDGTLTADIQTNTDTTTNGTYIRKNGVFTADNTVYCASCYFKQGSQPIASITMYSRLSSGSNLRVLYDLNAGTYTLSNIGSVSGGTAGMEYIGNGWWRVWASANMLTGLDTTGLQFTPSIWAIPSAIGSEYGYIWGAQLNEGELQPYYSTTVKNLLGYSQNFENAAWAKSNSSVLYNLLTYSEQFDNAAWVKGATVTITANAITAPDGTTTADKFNYSAISTGPSQTAGSTTSTYTISTYVKPSNTSFCRLRVAAVGGGGSSSFSSYFNIATGVVSSTGVATADFGSLLPSITSVGNGWYRISVTFTVLSAVTSITYGIVAAQTSGGASAAGDELYVWGAQLVQSTSPEEYTATTSASTPIQAIGPFGFDGGQKLVEDSATNTHLTQQTPTFALGSVYTQSVYAKAGERTFLQLRSTSLATFSASFDLVNGTYSQVTTNTVAFINSIGNGWFRCSITFTAGATGASAARVAIMQNATTQSYTGDGTSGIYIFGAQLSDSASLDPYSYNPVAAPTSTAYYGPRFDYDPVTLAPKGLLIEEQRTNLIPYSRYESGQWAFSAATVGNQTKTGVDGASLTAFLANATTSAHRVYRTLSGSYTANSIYTFSFYVAKPAISDILGMIIRVRSTLGGQAIGVLVSNAGENSIYTFNSSIPFGTNPPAAITASNFSATNVGNNWVRISVTTAIASIDTTLTQWDIGFSTVSGSDTGLGTANSQIFIDSVQLEVGAFPTSYIPTTSATVTRAADNASMVGSNFSSWYNQSGGTLVVNGDTVSNSGNRVYFDVGANGAFGTTAYTVQTSTYVGLLPGAAPVNMTSTVTTTALTNKIATAMQNNNSIIAVNASLGVVDAACTMPASATTLTVGGTQFGGTFGNYLNGHIQSIKYYPTRLPNADLQRLTR